MNRPDWLVNLIRAIGTVAFIVAMVLGSAEWPK